MIQGNLLIVKTEIKLSSFLNWMSLVVWDVVAESFTASKEKKFLLT
jgi:hypothetical protein